MIKTIQPSTFVNKQLKTNNIIKNIYIYLCKFNFFPNIVIVLCIVIGLQGICDDYPE